MTKLSTAINNATDRQFWNFLGQRITNLIVDRAKQGRDVHGGSFPGYTPQYRKYKSRGMTRITDGQKLKAYKGKSISSRSTKADLTLTGQMLSGLQVRNVNDSGSTIGWNAQESAKVEGLIENDYQLVNLKAGAPFADREMRELDTEINKRFDKATRKWARKTETIRIGR